MNAKKCMVLFLILALSFSLVACSGTDEPTTETAAPETETSTEEPKTPATTDTDSGLTGVLDGVPVPSLAGFTIGISAVGTTNNFDRSCYQSMIDRVEELGGTVISTDGERDDQKLVANLENLMTQTPDAIVQMLGDTAVCDPVFAQISEAGIPLFTVDHPSVYSICNSSSDNYAIATTLARTIFEDIGGEGMVAVFNGFYGVRTSAIRYDLLKYVAQDYPNVTFLEPDLIDVTPGTAEDAYKQMQDLLTIYPEGSELKAITAAWDIPGIGCCQALADAGRNDIKVYGIDGDPTALELLADPDSAFQAIMVQNPVKIGQAIIDEMARYLAGQEIPSAVYVQPVLATKDNVQSVIEELYN